MNLPLVCKQFFQKNTHQLIAAGTATAPSLHSHGCRHQTPATPGQPKRSEPPDGEKSDDEAFVCRGPGPRRMHAPEIVDPNVLLLHREREKNVQPAVRERDPRAFHEKSGPDF
jgi:hypothetical protein